MKILTMREKIICCFWNRSEGEEDIKLTWHKYSVWRSGFCQNFLFKGYACLQCLKVACIQCVTAFNYLGQPLWAGAFNVNLLRSGGAPQHSDKCSVYPRPSRGWWAEGQLFVNLKFTAKLATLLYSCVGVRSDSFRKFIMVNTK
jgi:hypothetical protein